MIHDVVIVGLGAMGSATLWQLARRGASVLGIDRHDPPHPFGSTHGESRVTRRAIGEGADYVPLAIRSHEIWRELEAETGDDLLHEVGCLVIARTDGPADMHGGPFFPVTIEAARRYGIAHELLDAGAVRERFPQFRIGDGESAYFEPGGGWVRPERCVAANLSRARALGAQTRVETEVLAIAQHGDRVVVTTPGEDIVARRAIVSAGAGAGALLGPPFADLLMPTRQALHWFAIDGLADRWAAGPVYIWLYGETGDDHFYGFPEIDGGGTVKVAAETYGPRIDPRAVDREVPQAEAAAMHARHVAPRLAGVSARRVRSATCLYTQAPSSRFVIADHPAADRILVVSPCSGHGFKHSAAIGEAVARRVLGEAETLLAPFALA